MDTFRGRYRCLLAVTLLLNGLPNNSAALNTVITGNCSVWVSHSYRDTIFQSASRHFLSLSLAFCCFFLFSLSSSPSYFLPVFTLCRNQRENPGRVCQLLYLHTSSNTECSLIKGATYLLSTHRASHLNRLPVKLDTSKTITGPRIFLDNV